ncbi:hypothetical protein QWZ10_14645 [Paracoccus cavernae]|uniref:Uncharacterized protein n=1 Tax=Paracoccus cavernae TaxID=1571207 RepID=A0ABT8DBA8_9RHOB|nr:hypothetical protein [Paracoccus cavernae]
MRISALSVAGNPASDLSRLALVADGAVSGHEAPAPVVRALAGSGRERDAAMTALQYRDLGPFFVLFALLGLLPQLRRQA